MGRQPSFCCISIYRPSMAPGTVTARATGAIIAAISVSMVLFSYLLRKRHSKDHSRKNTKSFSVSKKCPTNGLVGAIGNTPLIRINSLSEATGCEASFISNRFYLIEVFLLFTDFLFGFGLVREIYCLFELHVSRIMFDVLFYSGFQILGKCEFLNPGGSVKDRVAVKIIEEVSLFYFLMKLIDS